MDRGSIAINLHKEGPLTPDPLAIWSVCFYFTLGSPGTLLWNNTTTSDDHIAEGYKCDAGDDPTGTNKVVFEDTGGAFGPALLNAGPFFFSRTLPPTLCPSLLSFLTCHHTRLLKQKHWYKICLCNTHYN